MPERFGRIIAPVYRQVGTSLVHEGTAVLVKSASRFWLLTAAHTLNDPPGRRWLAAQPNFELRPAVWHGDPLDVAFLELRAQEAEALTACGQAFLPFDRVDATGTDNGNGRMVVTGFPSKSVDVNGADLTVQVRLTRLTSRFFTVQELKVRKVDPLVHMAGLFKVLADERGPIQKMDMTGLSGGGIWHSRNAEDVRLVGIVNQYDPIQRILIGTGIRPMILEMKRFIEGSE